MTSLDEVDPEDEPRSFRQAPAWQRLIVLAAGSFMHFVLAAVIIFGLALGIGIENDNTTQLGTVAACVPQSADCPEQRRRVYRERPEVARRAGGPQGRRPGDVLQRGPGEQLDPARRT